jgi:hypothetical protein
MATLYTASGAQEISYLRRSLLIRLSETVKKKNNKLRSHVQAYFMSHTPTFVRAATVATYDNILTGAACKLRVLQTFTLGIDPQLQNRKPLYNLEYDRRGRAGGEIDVCVLTVKCSARRVVIVLPI